MNDNSKDNQSGIGDIFKGLGKLVNVIVDMAEKNINEKKDSGDLFNTDNGLKGKYAFSMKLGMDEKDIGHIIQNPQVIEPQTDIFKEDELTVVIVEMPGVKDENFEYSIHGKALHIMGKDNIRTYEKTIDISELNVNLDEIEVNENNGIYKIVIKHGKSE